MAEHLVGRAEELAAIDAALAELALGRSGTIALMGEPGIGKTRLLKELAARAAAVGHPVLFGVASELERNLPFSVFIDALDDYLDGLEPNRVAVLGDEARAELAQVFPAVAAPAVERGMALQHERYRTHRAVRDLLAELAARNPLVLVLDDFHWADGASVELLGALLRRPPAGGVLIALAVRPHQMPLRLATALERAESQDGLTRIEIGPLTLEEVRGFLGDAVGSTETAALYEESGGNPFYLQQLARAPRRAARPAAVVEDEPLEIGVPIAVAAAMTEELASLSDSARLVLQGAAVAGDPFDPELAAAAAAIPGDSAIRGIDELLGSDLVRPTDVPRRFRFRHPLVRRAIYDAAPGGWRLGAHERCAEALMARGASAVVRAHHIELCAREGDLTAVALLRDAGEASARLAPATAAHWFAAALRLLPDNAPEQQRAELLLAHAEALAATGHFADSHDSLLQALRSLPEDSTTLRITLSTACARVEHRLGQYEQAHAHLMRALGDLPESASAQAADLMIELALNEFYRSHYPSMHDWAERAASTAQRLEDPALTAAALAVPALADAMTGSGERGHSHHAGAAVLVDGLTDDQLSRRLDAGAWLAAAELYVDLYAEADAHASRALRLARASGQGELFLVLNQILSRAWYVRGKVAEVTELLDGAIEAARLAGNVQALAGNLFNRSVVALARGDLDTAMTAAQESVDLAHDLDPGFVTAWAAIRLAEALLETGRAAEAVELLLDSAGGEDLTLIPGGWRAYCLELLTRCSLAVGRRDGAKRAAARAEATAQTTKLPLAAAWAERAAAAVALHDGDAAHAATLALSSAAGAEQVGAPIEAALSRTLAGRALAQAGQPDRAIIELQRAATELDACGALRYRAAAERELGRLGHRVHRRTRPGAAATGIGSLTERELQVGGLVVARRTNAQIAAELYLSQKTVETHLRNIFHKIDVSSRVDLARAIERARRDGRSPLRGTGRST